jgi:SOS response regulatory protein OraA/RecX
MEMGLGNAELLRDLYSPETSTAAPADITPIVKTATDPAPTDPATIPPKGKEVAPPKDGEAPEVKNTIADFLGNHTEENDDDPDDAPVDTPPANADTDPAPQSNQFTALANDLFKLGVFNKDEDEQDVVISTPEDFLERFNSEKKKGAIDMVNQFIGQFGEDYQNAFDAIYVKGVDPREYFSVYNEAVNYAEMDLTIESNQEAVMRRSLTEQGFEKEDVDTEIERLKNYGDLETVAARNHKVLIKKDAVKMQDMEQKAQHELAQKAQTRNQYITNVQTVVQEKLKAKEFDGIPMNPKLAAEVQDFLLVDKYKTPSGELLSDFDKMILDLKKPENHANKVKIALLLKVLEKDPTLSTIQKTGITKQTNQLFTEVARQVEKDKTPIANKNTPKSWFQ